jgi:transposase InsO family protein
MERDKLLKAIYYNPKKAGALGGVEALFRAAKKKDPAIRRAHVIRYLQQQLAYSLHKPIRRRFKRNRTIVGAIDKQWQVDLADMTRLGRVNGGYRYLLTCIDCFSRYAWVVPVKRKNAKDMVEAFEKLFAQSHPRLPQRIQSDKGKEFINSKVQTLFKANGIKHFASESEYKAAMVERFNRTLKTKLWRHFTATNTTRFLEVLPDVVRAYNRSLHRAIGMRPIDVKPKDELKIWTRTQQAPERRAEPAAAGQPVRISKSKTIFEKGYLPNWSEVVYKVDRAIRHPKRVYKLRDETGDEVKGTFYKEHIQPTSEDIKYIIEKVIRKRKTGDNTELYVKWKGWPTKYNSWIAETELVNYGE